MTGWHDTVLKLGSGEERAPALTCTIWSSRPRVIPQRAPLGIHSRYNRKVVEQAAIPRRAQRCDLRRSRPRLRLGRTLHRQTARCSLEGETDRGWQGQFIEGEGFLFERTVRGVKEVAIIDHALLGSADARRLDLYAAALQGAYAKPGTLRRKGEAAHHDPWAGGACSRRSPHRGRKGLTLQRYKGLGEMNPGQLWETTLTRDARSLLQVKVKEIDEASDIFAKLMGAVAQPRRIFIQDNALAASVDA